MKTQAISAFSPPLGQGATFGLATMVAGFSASIRRYRAFRTARSQLMALDDRMLKDIGISRSEITSVLRDRSGERRIDFCTDTITGSRL